MKSPWHLGTLEKKIMEHLWSCQCQRDFFSVRQIHEALQNKDGYKPYAYNTILTVLGHLFCKGLVRRYKKGKTFYYHHKLSKSDFVVINSHALFRQMQQEYGQLALVQFVNLVENIDPRLLAAAKKEMTKLRQNRAHVYEK